MFIRRDYARNGFNSRHIEQDLGCVDLIAVDASKCCQINTTCPVFRTAKKIPKTIRYNFEEYDYNEARIDNQVFIRPPHFNTSFYNNPNALHSHYYQTHDFLR